MAKNKKNEAAQAVDTTPAQEPELSEAAINEVDGDPIFHADEEAGDGDE